MQLRAESPPPVAHVSDLHVSGVLARALADVAQQCGVSPHALLGDKHAATLTMPFEVRVPLTEYATLFARAIQLTGDPTIGLRCAFYAPEASFDLLAPLVSHVPTLRHAVREIRQFQSLIFEGVHVQLTERAGTARLRCALPRLSRAFDRSCAELVMGGLYRMVQAFGARRSEVQAVYFEHARPSHHAAYTEAFGGAERFSQAFTGIEFAAQVLDRQHLHSNPALHTVLHAQAERSLAQLDHPKRLADRLKVYLRTHRGPEVPKMALVARDLGMSVRSLRRRLDEEGETFRALIQCAFRDRACTLLRNPDLTVQDVADALGFADTTVFHRAFKRWTGTTPTEYRDSSKHHRTDAVA